MTSDSFTQMKLTARSWAEPMMSESGIRQWMNEKFGWDHVILLLGTLWKFKIFLPLIKMLNSVAIRISNTVNYLSGLENQSYIARKMLALENSANFSTVHGLHRLYYGNIHHSLLANALTALRGAFHALKWRILLFFRIRNLLEGYTHQYYSKLCYTFLRSFTVTYLLCTKVHKTL